MTRLRWSSLPRAKKILLAAAVVPALAVYWFGQITFFIDSHTYAMHGYYLFQPFSACDYYWRSLGYPLTLFLTGERLFKSFEGILILQMVAAIAMPWLLFRTVRLVSPRTAYWVTLAFCLTLLPYLFQNTIYPDQMQVALGFVVTYYAARTMRSPKPENFKRLIVWCGVMMLFRPSLLAMYLILPLLLWRCVRIVKNDPAARTRYLNQFAIGTACILAVQIGFAQWTAHVAQRCTELSLPAMPDHYSLMGRQMFLNAYLYSYGIPEAFSEKTGPVTAYFTKEIHSYVTSEALQQSLRNQQHLPKLRELTQASPDINGMADYLLTHPHHDYFWLIYFAPLPDSVFRDVAVEMYLAHPEIFARMMWIHWNGFAFGAEGLRRPDADFSYLYLVPNFSPAWIILDANHSILPPRLADELRGHLEYRYITQEMSDWINASWSAYYAYVAAAVMILATAGLFLLPLLASTALARRRYRKEIQMLLVAQAVWVMQVLPLFVLVIPQFRYQAEAVLAGIPAAALTAWVGWRLLFPPQPARIDKQPPAP